MGDARSIVTDLKLLEWDEDNMSKKN